MYKKITLAAFTVLLFSGCASVPMESTEKSDMVKSLVPQQMARLGYISTDLAVLVQH